MPKPTIPLDMHKSSSKRALQRSETFNIFQGDIDYDTQVRRALKAYKTILNDRNCSENDA